MLLVKLHFPPALLLLVLSCPLWQGSQSVPVMKKGPMSDSCVSYAQTLLQNITNALTQKNLFRGITCTKQSMELYMETHTISVCAPKGQKCSEITESDFNEDSCLTNIGKDLLHYYSFLAVQPDLDSVIGQSVLFSLRDLMKNCFSWTWPTHPAADKPATRPSTFDERLNLCKVLKGFQVRTITINRIIGYINSGEHTK